MIQDEESVKIVGNNMETQYCFFGKLFFYKYECDK